MDKSIQPILQATDLPAECWMRDVVLDPDPDGLAALGARVAGLVVLLGQAGHLPSTTIYL